MTSGTPLVGQGQVVGLLGGSFDPPHQGHLRITEAAIARLGLDWAWWVVSPGNPLKKEGPAPLERRIAAARGLIDNPRVKVTDIEAKFGTRYTAETLARLQSLHPDVRFVWIMGSDNLAQLHQWKDWRHIMERVPVAVMARPGKKLSARFAPAARAYRGAQLNESEARALARREAPAWVVLNLPLMPQSSSAIRAAGGWRR